MAGSGGHRAEPREHDASILALTVLRNLQTFANIIVRCGISAVSVALRFAYPLATRQMTAAVTNTVSTRDRLLACARDIYLSDGLAGLSMRKVAQMAGVSATAIYRHFDSKEALVAAVAEEGFVLFAKYLWSAFQSDTPRERLRATSTGYLRFALEQTPYYRVIFLSPTDALGFTEMPETVRRKATPTFQFLVDRVRECIAAGILVDEDPADLAATIWSHSHGIVSLYLNGNLRVQLTSENDFESFYHRSLERLVRGLAP